MKQLFVALAVVFTAGTALAQEAPQLYQQKCAACHGKDGKGTAVGLKMGAKDFATANLSEAEMTKVITDGKNKMPAFKGKLTDAQIQAIAKYIKNGLK